MTSAQFRATEKAWWLYVDAACPYPIHSRHRYTWIREHNTFEYKGSHYQRSSTPVLNPDGSRGSGSRVVFRDLEHPERVIEGLVSSAQSIMSRITADISI